MRCGADVYDALVSDASRETFLQRLFKADCYSRSLAAVNKDCRCGCRRTALRMLRSLQN